MEKEYIEREALKKRLEDFSKWCKDGRKQGVDFVLDCPLPDMPAADVVEVVRCKDCVNRYTPDCAMWYRCQNCDGQWSWETDNDFCSYGERKGANEYEKI